MITPSGASLRPVERSATEPTSAPYTLLIEQTRRPEEGSGPRILRLTSPWPQLLFLRLVSHMPSVLAFA